LDYKPLNYVQLQAAKAFLEERVDGKANLPTLEETDWSLDNPDEATRYKNMSADEREVRKMSVFLLMFSLGFF